MAMWYYQWGCRSQTDTFYGGIQYIGIPVADVSRSIYLNRTPMSRRPKPAPDQLIWSSEDYAHFKRVWRFQEYVQKRTTGFNAWAIETRTARAVSGDWSPTLAPQPLDPMNQLLGKIKADVANLANMLGEYKESAKTICHLGTNLLYSIRAAKRLDLVQAWKFLEYAAHGSSYRSPIRKFSGGWLQYRFGIKTVIDDIYKIAAELDSRIEQPILQKASIKKRTSLSGIRNIGTSEVQCRYESHGFLRLTAFYTIDNSLLKNLSDHGITNPLSLAWELTTLSWCVDYVIGIGEWLSALDVPHTLSKSICYQTVKIASNEKLVCSGSANQGTSVKLLTYPEARLTAVNSSRSVRSLSAVTPVWKPSLTTIRVTNLIALGVQLRSEPERVRRR